MVIPYVSLICTDPAQYVQTEINTHFNLLMAKLYGEYNCELQCKLLDLEVGGCHIHYHLICLHSGYSIDTGSRSLGHDASSSPE